MPRPTNARNAASAWERKLSRKDGQIRTLKGRIDAYDRICNEIIAERDEARVNFSKASDLVGEQQRVLEDLGHQARIMRGQLDALDAHVNALAQRYAGVKLDCQQFTFAAAQDWLKSERNAVIFKLDQVRRDYGDGRNNGELQAMSADLSRVG